MLLWVGSCSSVAPFDHGAHCAMLTSLAEPHLPERISLEVSVSDDPFDATS